MYETRKSAKAGPANSTARGGKGRPTVVRRGGNRAIPATHCTAARKAFDTGTY